MWTANTYIVPGYLRAGTFGWIFGVFSNSDAVIIRAGVDRPSVAVHFRPCTDEPRKMKHSVVRDMTSLIHITKINECFLK